MFKNTVVHNFDKKMHYNNTIKPQTYLSAKYIVQAHSIYAVTTVSSEFPVAHVHVYLQSYSHHVGNNIHSDCNVFHILLLCETVLILLLFN